MLALASVLLQAKCYANTSYSQSNCPAPINSRTTSLVSPTQANTLEVPHQILKTGINLSTKTASPNSLQLAKSVGLLPVLQEIQSLRNKLDDSKETSNDVKQNLLLLTIQAMQILQETSFSIDFVLAEISAEENIYTSVLNTFTGDRDKAVFKTNAMSFIANGALWAVAEGLDIPTFSHPRYSISSGTNGILAGVVPSIASIYALHQLDGKKRMSESDPNMLAKLFDYPTNVEVEYPEPVWQYLNLAPAEDSEGKTRRELLIDRWIMDKNMSSFTDKSAKKQLDVITASVPRKKALSIESLTVRQTMLQQLGAEILKMKRMLYELSMVVHGEKTI